MAALAEPPVHEDQRAGEHGEATGQERDPRAQLRPVVRAKPLEAPHRDDGGGEERDGGDRARADGSGQTAEPVGSVTRGGGAPGPIEAVTGRLHSDFTALVTWSSIVMRRFLVFASPIACACA